jgi:hypothetical protein
MSSVGLMGAIAAFLLFSIKGSAAHEPELIAVCADGLSWIGWWLVVPLCIAALVSGILQSLITSWGLFQYYWVLLKLLAMIGATGLLFLHMNAVEQLAGNSRIPVSVASGLFASLSFDAIAALVLLAVLSALSIYKPPGRVMTRAESPGPR